MNPRLTFACVCQSAALQQLVGFGIHMTHQFAIHSILPLMKPLHVDPTVNQCHDSTSIAKLSRPTAEPEHASAEAPPSWSTGLARWGQSCCVVYNVPRTTHQQRTMAIQSPSLAKEHPTRAQATFQAAGHAQRTMLSFSCLLFLASDCQLCP